MGAPEPPAPGRGGSIVCLVGPTGVGKTGLVAALARKLPLEVISLDSRQIYKGLRIGTAQPTAQERALCPHHLVDFVPVDQQYDAACYRRDFARVHGEILARGHIPVLVGGAGFYLKALTDGFMPLPPAEGKKLADIRGLVNTMPAEVVRSRLAEVDPVSRARIHPHDLYRQRRALEIHLLTGRSMSDHMAAWRPEPCAGLAYSCVLLQRPVAELDHRIRRRLHGMLAGGWVEETARALRRFGPEAPGLQSIGYPEIIRFLDGGTGQEEMEEAIYRQTRQYAKRQRTWFRKLQMVLVGHPDEPGFQLEVASLVGRG